MITERCPWIDLFITTWAGVTYWRGQITRSRYSCGLYRRSALLTKLFAGHIVTTRSTGCHTSRLSLYIKKLYALLSISKQQFSIDIQISRVLKTLYTKRDRSPCHKGTKSDPMHHPEGYVV